MSKETRYIERERLAFREIEDGDTEDLVRWRSNPDNIRYFINTEPLTVAKHLKWLKNYYGDNRRMDFVIIEKHSMKTIGVVGVQDINHEKGTASVAYMVGEPEARGRGYGREAVIEICKYAFECLCIKELDAIIHRDNLVSQKLVLGIGFKLKELQSEELVFGQYVISKEEFEVVVNG